MLDRPAMTPMQQAVVALQRLRARNAELERASSAPIAIIGMGCRYPAGSDSPDAMWQALLEGRDGSREVPRDRWDIDALYDPEPGRAGRMYVRKSCFLDRVDGFEPLFFRISPREAIGIDPQQRLLLEVTWEALEDAGIAPPSLVGSRTGVYVGISTNDYSALLSRTAHGSGSNAAAGAGNAASVASGRISYSFGFQGPCMAVDTACSSSLVATHLAVQALRARECGLAIVAGVNLMLTPDITINFCLGRMLSPDGACKTFDAGADGYVRGEGCGALVLKRLSDAVADGDRVLAVIRGSAVNQDGRSAGLTAPNGPAQEAVIRAALANAGLTPDDIDAIEAHGTGTALGDPIEMHALRAVFGSRAERPLHVASVKTNIGHCEAAAGTAGLIKAALMLRHQAIPASLHFTRLNPHIDLAGADIRVPTEPVHGGVRRVGVSSFGFSGTNVHIVLEAPPAPPVIEAEPGDAPVLFLSARTEPALRALIARYRDHLATTTDGFADICHTARVGRAKLPWWVAVRAPGELASAIPSNAPPPSLPATQGRRVALPTTPFQRERFWIDAPAEAAPAAAPDDDGAHPLLGRPIPLPLSSERRWSCVIDLARPATAFLAQHRIEGQAILPASAYVEMALAAFPGQAIEALEITAPLRLADAAPAHLHTIAADGAFRILSHRPEDPASAPVIHATGRLAPRAAPSAPPAASGDTPLDPAALYDALNQRGIQHGPAFRLLGAIRRGPGTASATLAPPAPEPRFALHPATLDAAFQLVAAAVAAEAGATLVPGGIGHIALHRRPGPAPRVTVTARPEGDGITADLALIDDEGVALEVRGLRFLPRPGSQAFWQEARHPAPLLEGLAPPAFLPSAARLGAALAPEAARLAALHDMDAYARQGEALESVATAYVVQALRRLGLPFKPGAQLTFGALSEALGIAERHHRLFRRLLSMLAEDGILKRDGRRWTVLRAPPEAPPAIDAVLAAAPAMQGEVAVLRRCGEALADVLTGRTEPLALLFPANEAGAGAFYETSAYAHTVNGLLRAAATRLAAATPKGRRLRVVEVGAGTGGATGALLEALPEAARHYRFTDVSQAFLTAATRKFAGADLSTALLDIERDPAAQGFAPGCADVVLAANVLHATADLGATLAHIRGLLAPGGVLLLVESTARRRWIDIVFGLTEGWWRFTDTTRRPDHPLLTLDAWRALLAESGFEVPGDATGEVILARRLPERPAAGPAWHISGEAGRAAALLAGAGARLAGASQAEALLHILPPVAATAPAQEALLADLVSLAREAMARPVPPRLVIVADGTLGHAGLPGFVRSLALEVPALAPRLLVAPPSAEALVDEVLAGDGEAEVGWDAEGRRTVPRLRATPAPRAPDRVGGTWLITGGSGGLAREIATWLAAHGAARILLLSRRAATPPALPIPAQHIAADAADTAAIARLLTATPDLQGIVHAAGLLADAPIAAQDEATIAPVLRAKIAGALALDAAIRALPAAARPRHLVFCASAAGVIGSARQANHAFASAFLDGLASLRRAEGMPAISLDWGVWRGTGSAAALGFDRQAEGLGLGSIAPEEGQRLFGAALGADAARLILLPSVDWRRFAGLFGATPPGLFRDVAAAPAPRAPAPAQAAPQPTAAPAAPRPDVARIVAEVLGLQGAVATDVPLHDLGLDSLMAVEIRNRLAAEAGLDVSVRALIEGATVASLTPAGAAPPSALARGDVARIVAEVLGLATTPDAATPLHDLGLDSLMAVEIRNRLAAEAGIDVSVRALIEGATIASLTPAVSEPTPAPARGDVARIVAEVLGLATTPDPATPLHDLGLDSLMAVEIRNRLAAEAGIDVPVRTLIEGATIASLLGAAPAPATPVPTQAAPRALVPDLASRHAPFPLTDMQQAYWLGRRGDLALGATACTLYTEFDSTVIDLARAEAALNVLIRRHDMLRAIILPDGTQRILADVPHYAIEILDLDGDPTARLAALRESLAARVAEPDHWPLFDIRATRFGGTTRLHLSFDLIALDAASIHALRQEWGLLYEQPDAALPPIGISFRDHVLAEIAFRETAAYQRDLAYWAARSLPPGPDLPLLGDLADGTRRPFRRHRAILPATQAEALKREARAQGLTLPTLLAAAYAETLAAWARQDRFCLTVTAFNRPPRHPDMPRVLGDFTSTILLEVDARPAGFAARAQTLARRLAEDMDHATVSGIEVLRQAARQSGEAAAYSPYVFTSALGFRRAGDAPETDATGFDRLGRTVFNVSSTPQVIIDHQVSEEDGQLLCSWDVVESLFAPGTVPAMVAAWRGLLDDLAAGRGWNRSVAAMLPALSRAALLPAAAPELLQAGFERQARANPAATALVTPEIALDYGTLDAAATHLAAVLRERLGGDARDRLVAIGYPKGWRQIVAVLATLKAGAAYLPVDPALPADRRALLVERGEALLLEEAAPADAALAAARAGAPLPALPPVEDPARLAYVIYTSGSTGEPKGVMIEHAAAIATVAEVNRRWAIGTGDRALGLSQLGFDLSVWDIFGIFAAGGALVLPAPEASRDPSHWGELCARHAVTVWNSVPALVAMQLEYGLPPDHRLRLVMMSGDWVPLDLIPRLRAQAPAARLVALGGATEAAIWSNAHEIEALDPAWPSIPYGLPLAGQMLHVVNRRGEPCPDWTIGEIEISGAGLARGYWRDPVLTAERFIRNPLTGERRYRTGDLGRFRPHGEATGPTPIEFLGREDFQVKVQGYRIELGEIEAALASHPAVAQAVVTAHAAGAGRDRVLHGFYVPKAEFQQRTAHLLERRGLRHPPARLLPLPHRPAEAAYDTRRSHRYFTGEAPPMPALQALLRAGDLALRVLLDAACLRWDGDGLRDAERPAIIIPDAANAAIVERSAFLLLLEPPGDGREARIAAGRAAQRMMEAAPSLGLGLCPIGRVLCDGTLAIHALAGGIPAPGQGAADLGAALRAHLRQRLPAYMVPASLTPIDRVPLSSNGKVDRKALVPKLLAGEDGQRQGLARDVAADVAAVLGVPVPEADRSLFELGATSLSLVSIQRRLAEHYGRAIPLQAIFARPTVTALVEELQSGRAATNAVVTFGQAADDRRPRLVLMPGILSLPFYLRDLAAAVSRFAIISVQLPGMAEGETPLDSIEAQADYVVAKLRQDQRHGPYLLAGHSFGGLIAIEVARRLRAMGEAVPLLLLGDTLRTTARFDEVQSDEIAYTAMTRGLEALYGASLPMDGADAETRFRRTAAAMQEAGRFGPLTLPLDRMVAMFKANFRALGAYRPEPIEGDVALIRSDEGFPAELRGLDSAAAAEDPHLGWGDVVRGRITLRRLPGDHLAMLSAANLPRMAALMTELAEAATAIDPALVQAARDAATRAGQPVAEADFAVTAETFRDQAAAAAAAAIRAIADGATPPDAAALVAQHGVIPRYRFWLDRMLPEAARIGADAVPPSTHAILGVDRLGFGPAARDFLDRVIAGLPGLLTGQEHAAAIYLADETPDVYGKLFAEPNAALAAILARLAAQRPIEVLELGGGLGTTLAAIEGSLPPGRLRYRFTDLNAHLLRRAERRFAGRDWLEFGTLDMDQPPAEARRFDVVLASSALHAAPDIARALRHARAWLKPDGLLLALEETRFFPWFDLGMGLQAGFDDRTDLALRPLHPLLSREQWQDALAEAGFRASAFVAGDGTVAARLGFDVILAAP
uniref:non-ribosomal peptide synthetase n=1 Tax=Falsiroseomonas ponticola TaxID=2786951 RepID=UPI0019317E4E|nr:non-ribosomal peptide synthetase [Roseomonas ponticola]